MAGGAVSGGVKQLLNPEVFLRELTPSGIDLPAGVARVATDVKRLPLST